MKKAIESLVIIGTSSTADFRNGMPNRLVIARKIGEKEVRSNYILEAEATADSNIAQFIEERCEVIDQGQAPNADLYAAYHEFCNVNGEYPRSHRRFSQQLKANGFSQRHANARFWIGIQLKDPAAQTTD